MAQNPGKQQQAPVPSPTEETKAPKAEFEEPPKKMKRVQDPKEELKIPKEAGEDEEEKDNEPSDESFELDPENNEENSSGGSLDPEDEPNEGMPFVPIFHPPLEPTFCQPNPSS